jgi:hypothetical protein
VSKEQPFYKQPATSSDVFAIMLVGLKLSRQIDWSWWWVMSPIWISLVLVAVIAMLKGGTK